MLRTAKLVDHANPGNNSYGVLRLLAAIAVIYSHAWVITSGIETDEPLEALTGYPVGAHAVHLFFILSGLMVTASLERSHSIFSFVLARIARIYPAMLFVIVMLILLGGLFLTTASSGDYWTVKNIGYYFIRNVLFIGGATPLEGVYQSLPIPEQINAPLWTLKFEIICYLSLVIGLLFVQKLVRSSLRQRALVAIAFVPIVAAILLHHSPPAYDDSSALNHLIRMGFAFYVGSLAWHFRAKLILSAPFVLVMFMIAAIFTGLSLPLKEQVQILFLAYAAFWVGHFDFGKIKVFVDRQDYSYGIYITGWPIQQFLIMTFPAMGGYNNFLLAALLSILCAAITWNMIERPVLRLKKQMDARASSSAVQRSPSEMVPLL